MKQVIPSKPMNTLLFKMCADSLVHSAVGHFWTAHRYVNQWAVEEGSRNGVLGLKNSALAEIIAVNDSLLWHFECSWLVSHFLKCLVITSISYYN